MIQQARQFGPVGVAQKLGVETKSLDRVFDLIDYPMARTMAAAEKFKILCSVVASLAVFVMNGFVTAKRATDFLFHNVSMFKNILAGRFAVFSRYNKSNVTVPTWSFRDLLVRMACLIVQTLCELTTRSSAKTPGLSLIERPIFSANNGHIDSALDAGDLNIAFTVAFATFCTAWNRTVARIYAKLLSVLGNIAGSTKEFGVTYLTFECSFLHWVGSTMGRFIRTITFCAAKFTIFAGACSEYNIALFARYFYHRFLRFVTTTYEYSAATCSSTFKFGA